MTCLELLREWLDFSEDFLDLEWWAVLDKQNPEATAEGQKLKELQDRTFAALYGDEYEP